MDPFNSQPAPVSEVPAGGPPCPRCRQPMDPAQASYDALGKLICRSCAAQQTVDLGNRTIEQQDPGSTRNLYGASAATALFGVGTCCVAGMGQFYFVISPMAVFVAAATIYHASKDAETRQRLGNGYFLVVGLSVVGGLFGLLGTAIGLLGMVGSGLAAR